MSKWSILLLVLGLEMALAAPVRTRNTVQDLMMDRWNPKSSEKSFFFRKKSAAEILSFYQRGYRLTTVSISDQSTPQSTSYTGAFVRNEGYFKVENAHWVYGQTREALERQLENESLLIQDLTVSQDREGRPLFSAALVPADPEIARPVWHLVTSPDQVEDYVKRESIQVVDIEVYSVGTKSMVEIVGVRHAMGRAPRPQYVFFNKSIQEAGNECRAKGMRVIQIAPMRNGEIRNPSQAYQNFLGICEKAPRGQEKKGLAYYVHEDWDYISERVRVNFWRVLSLESVRTESGKHAYVGVFASDMGAFPMNGNSNFGTPATDRAAREIMKKFRIPGISLAFFADGKLQTAKAYGWADFEEERPLTPKDMLRIGSVSKMLTGAALMRLTERSSARWSDTVFGPEGHLSKLKPLVASNPDLPNQNKWVNLITLQDLMRHRAGWMDRAKNTEEYGESISAYKKSVMDELIRYKIRSSRDSEIPFSADEMARYMQIPTGSPAQFLKLDAKPGSDYSSLGSIYSNTGPVIAGEVIEEISGRRYRDAVHALVLDPGQPLRCDTIQFYDPKVWGPWARYYGVEKDTALLKAISEETIHPAIMEKIPGTSSGSATGGWLCTPSALVHVLARMNGLREAGLFSRDSIEKYYDPTPYYAADYAGNYYGLGLDRVRDKPVRGGVERVMMKNGAMTGTRSTAFYKQFKSPDDAHIFAWAINGAGRKVENEAVTKEVAALYDILVKEMGKDTDRGGRDWMSRYY